jgi:putative nucleotide binding protein
VNTVSDRDRGRRGYFRINEEYAVILDYLPYGNPYSHRQSNSPVIQGLGTFYFTLFEATPGPALGQVKPGERIYIGPDVGYNYIRIDGIISFDDLTPTAKKELESALDAIIKEREKDFVNFLNNSAPLTTRLHQLELIPGIGKKMMWKALDERKLSPFQSFEDFEKRVGVKNLPQAIRKRIIEEMEGKDNFRLFVRYSKRRPESPRGKG